MQKLTDDDPATLAAFWPPEGKVTKERWEAVQFSDQLHMRPSSGHYVTVERDIICNMKCERPACLCGWHGEWHRRSA